MLAPQRTTGGDLNDGSPAPGALRVGHAPGAGAALPQVKVCARVGDLKWLDDDAVRTILDAAGDGVADRNRKRCIKHAVDRVGRAVHGEPRPHVEGAIRSRAVEFKLIHEKRE